MWLPHSLTTCCLRISYGRYRYEDALLLMQGEALRTTMLQMQRYDEKQARKRAREAARLQDELEQEQQHRRRYSGPAGGREEDGEDFGGSSNVRRRGGGGAGTAPGAYGRTSSSDDEQSATGAARCFDRPYPYRQRAHLRIEYVVKISVMHGTHNVSEALRGGGSDGSSGVALGGWAAVEVRSTEAVKWEHLIQPHARSLYHPHYPRPTAATDDTAGAFRLPLILHAHMGHVGKFQTCMVWLLCLVLNDGSQPHPQRQIQQSSSRRRRRRRRNGR